MGSIPAELRRERDVRNCMVVSRDRRNTFILEGRDGVDAMERGYVRGFDAVAKAELWERWRRGESLKAIGRAFGKPSSSIYFQVAPHGGFVLRRGGVPDWH